MTAELRAGAVLDQRFTLIRRLGAGSTGAVWQAEDADSGLVACKILHPQFGDDPALIGQMEREAQVLAQLDHPNLTRAVHFSSRGRFVFLAMEYVDGQPFHVVLGERTRQALHFSGPQAIELVGPVCEAVAYAHSKYIVHRDLKPQNVMVVDGPFGPQIKVLDFGLARLLEGSIFDATTFGRAMGSLFYMSPEQTRGEPATVRSDVFALGAMLFEVVTLHRAWARDASGLHVPAFTDPVPGAANSLTAVFERLARGQRPRVRDLRPEVPPPLDMLIQRSLAVDPTDRPSSVADLWLEARASLADLPDDAPFVPSGHRKAAALFAHFENIDPAVGPTMVLRPETAPTPPDGQALQAPPTEEFLGVPPLSVPFESPTHAQPTIADIHDDFDADSLIGQTADGPLPPSLAEPELPAAVSRRPPTVDTQPTRTVAPPDRAPAPKPDPVLAAAPERPIETTGTNESAATTQPGAFFTTSDRAPVAVDAEPSDRSSSDVPMMAIPPAELLPDAPTARPSPVAAIAAPRRPAVERRAPPPPTHVPSTTEMSAVVLDRLLGHPWFWVAAATAAAFVGGAIGYSFMAPGPSEISGVVEVVTDERRSWPRVERLLRQLDDRPDDPKIHRQLRDAILSGASSLPPGADRTEIERLASLSSAVGNPAGLKTAARLLMGAPSVVVEGIQ